VRARASAELASHDQLAIHHLRSSDFSTVGDCTCVLFEEAGDNSPPGGKSCRTARIRRMLTERAVLKLDDLLSFVLQKILDDFERMR
jgi:hypothetical protein